MFLAELDDENICIGIKQTKGLIDDGKHVEISGLDSDYLYRKYENGEWSSEKFYPDEPEPEPSIEEEILFENKYQTLLLEMEML